MGSRISRSALLLGLLVFVVGSALDGEPLLAAGPGQHQPANVLPARPPWNIKSPATNESSDAQVLGLPTFLEKFLPVVGMGPAKRLAFGRKWWIVGRVNDPGGPFNDFIWFSLSQLADGAIEGRIVMIHLEDPDEKGAGSEETTIDQYLRRVLEHSQACGVDVHVLKESLLANLVKELTMLEVPLATPMSWFDQPSMELEFESTSGSGHIDITIPLEENNSRRRKLFDALVELVRSCSKMCPLVNFLHLPDKPVGKGVPH